MNKAVIFDLDGTLIDSCADIADNVNTTLKHFGYKTLSSEEIKAVIGSGAKRLIKDAIAASGAVISDGELAERLEYYNRIYTSSSSPKTKLFCGIDTVLKELYKRGYILAILSNKPQVTADKVCSIYLKDFKFSEIIGEKDGVKCKPDKTATLNLLKRLNVSPENCYFVGDGETDVIPAISAGVNGVAALWGNRTKEQLFGAGARVFAQNPLELLDIIP